MSTVKTIYRNMVFLTVAGIVSKILQFFLMVYAARILDKGSFGKFNFALSISFIAIVLADLGVNSLLIREVARNRPSAGKYFVNSAFVKIIMVIVMFFAMAGFLNVMGYPDDTKQVVYIIWIFALISTFTELFYSIFRAFESMIFDSIIKIIRMAILTSAGIFALMEYQSVAAFSAVFVATEAIVFLIAYAIASKKFHVNGGDADFKFIKKLLRDSLPFGLSFVFSTIYFYISSVMLSKMRGDVEIASFSAAYNIILAVLSISTVYGNVIYPVMSRYFKSSKEGLKVVYGRSFKYLVMIGLPISAGLYLLAKDIMIFLYGEKYLASYIALQIVSWYVFIKFLNTLIGVLLSSIDKQGHRMLCQGMAALAIIVLNLALIPGMGFEGAAIATFVAEVMLFIMYYYYSSRFSYSYNPLPILLKSAAATAVMSLAIIYLDLDLIIEITIGAAVYFAAVLALRGLDSEDTNIIRQILAKEKSK